MFLFKQVKVASLPTVEPCQPVILSYGDYRSESYFSLDANELLKTRFVLYDRLNTFLLLLLQQKSKLLPRDRAGVLGLAWPSLVPGVALPWLQEREKER